MRRTRPEAGATLTIPERSALFQETIELMVAEAAISWRTSAVLATRPNFIARFFSVAAWRSGA
jgi:hypothetical protein